MEMLSCKDWYKYGLFPRHYPGALSLEICEENMV